MALNGPFCAIKQLLSHPTETMQSWFKPCCSWCLSHQRVLGSVMLITYCWLQWSSLDLILRVIDIDLKYISFHLSRVTYLFCCIC